MRKNLRKITAAFLCGTMLLSATACGNSDKGNTSQNQEQKIKDVATADIEKAVAEAYGEQYVAQMELTADDLKNLCGIDSELCEDFTAKAAAISTHVDRFFAFKAKSGKAEELKKQVEAYQETLKADTLQYPMNIPKIQASEVKVYGDYVFFIMLGFIDDTQAEDEEAMLKAFEEENQKAVKAVEGVLYGI